MRSLYIWSKIVGKISLTFIRGGPYEHGSVIFDILEQLFKNIAYVGSLKHFYAQHFLTRILQLDQEHH